MYRNASRFVNEPSTDRWVRRVLWIVIGLILAAGLSRANRIKDVSHVEGVRENQLVGYGLVVGLDGTGDGSSSRFTVQSLAAFLRRNGVTLDISTVKMDYVSAVIVTASLPPFARPGSRLDVTVSSIGDTESLQGGTLIMTPLKGPDGQVYAVAQGSISVGGFEAGSSGTSVATNFVTAGKIPGGALIETAPPTPLENQGELTLVLENPDFTTAHRVAQVINANFSEGTAKASDNTGIIVRVPAEYASRVPDFMAAIERLPVHPDQRARIVIDERTGTVVMGEDVRISTLAIAHGNLSIAITTQNDVSQPGDFAEVGETKRVKNSDVKATEEADRLTVVPEGVSLGEVVQSLNAIGVTPRDLISILQSIKAAGALQAELVIQ